ncbi:MAG: VWA domain-containing protein [Deltaproteobacteria bacterium]|nr:VWA domain-containing protein [Deltaproteobacteria bacterium]
MPRRTPIKKKSQFVLPPPPPIPQQTCWIESDSYDRAVYKKLRDESPSLQALEENGIALTPRFDALLQDLFSALFKMNVLFLKDSEVLPSASLNRVLLSALHQGDLAKLLREATLLDEGKAGLATVLLGEGALKLLKAEKPLTRRDLLDLWNMQKQEETVQEKIDEANNAKELSKDLAKQGELSKEAKELLEQAANKLASEARAEEARLRQQAKQLQEDLSRAQQEAETRFRKEAIKVTQNIEDAAQEAESWGVALGGGHKSSPGRQIELGKHLAGNEKLKKLAKMVGRMKEHALALRRKIFERTYEELFEVGIGAEVSRLLPTELMTLHHPILRKDFTRRFVDNELLLYSLRGIEEKGKGPVVVCLDGSSSMIGDKEVWAKALTLTLLEIARRQRRLFRAICFSSADTPLQIFDLNPRERYDVEMGTVMELAEYFPGGGTDFETPLNAARECIRQSRFKRGDIVFITDGECDVKREWAEEFRADKEEMGFSLFSILIDVGGSSSMGVLKEFSDKISTVSQLTSEGVKDLFVKL